MKITEWISSDGCSYRLIEGAEDIPANRVAFIEKTPRVRIRPSHSGDRGNGTRQWDDFLNWAEGYKGDGPDDELSKKWCDTMLAATGFYEFPNRQNKG